MDLADIEDSMQPGKLSRVGFLGPGDSLDEVLIEDGDTVHRLGLTHEAIAGRIEYFIIKTKSRQKRMFAGEVVIDGKYLVQVNISCGGQVCPWKDTGWMMPYGDRDFVIINQETGEEISFPGGIVHLIRQHHFFEGKRTSYRVDPERAARILGLLK